MKSITIPCPHCQKKSSWNVENPFRPFCSQRCKLIDLGDWIDARHVITGDDQDIMNDSLLNNETTQ